MSDLHGKIVDVLADLRKQRNRLLFLLTLEMPIDEMDYLQVYDNAIQKIEDALHRHYVESRKALEKKSPKK